MGVVASAGNVFKIQTDNDLVEEGIWVLEGQAFRAWVRAVKPRTVEHCVEGNPGRGVMENQILDWMEETIMRIRGL